MKGIQALRERKNQLAKEANNILVNVGDRTWTAQEQTDFDARMDETERLSAQIKAVEDSLQDDAQTLVNELNSKGLTAKPEQNKALHMYLSKRELTPADIAVIQNAMSTAVGAEGGFTVQTEVARVVTEYLKAFGGMREVAEVISVQQGNPMNMPESDGTLEEGEIVGENVQASVGEITFSNVSHVMYKFSSKSLALPWELIQDSGIDIVAFVLARLSTRIARVTNRMFTTGTGTAQPFGVVNRASAGLVGAAGSATSVTYDQLVDLQHSLDPAYRNSAVFMFSDNTLRSVRKIKDGQQRPIFVPGYETGVPGGAPDQLLGKRIVINQHMPDMAANAKAILFGAFQNYLIRDALAIDVRVFDDSAFALKGQRGFCAWARSGGQLNAPVSVKSFQNSAT